MNTTPTNPSVNSATVVGVPGVEYLPGDLVAELDEEGLAALADRQWISEHYSKGAFDEFRGQYIAVVNKTVLGHGKNRIQLIETVAAETGVPADRIITSLIFRQPWK
jgi:hypothetical protein